jgi:hypothetical protein
MIVVNGSAIQAVLPRTRTAGMIERRMFYALERLHVPHLAGCRGRAGWATARGE